MTEPFPLSPMAMFRQGVAGFRREPMLLLAGGVLTFAVYAAFRVPAQQALDDGRRVLGLGLDVLGAVAATTAAYPWFTYALAASRGEPATLATPFQSPGRFFAMFVAGFWFWAAVLLGFRYLFGIPAILAAVFYAFYGYIVADRHNLGGLKVLGTSVRLGDKRRIALFAVLTMFVVFNLFAAIPLGYGIGPASIAATVVLLLVTGSVTLVAGAALYDVLAEELGDG